MSRPKTLEEVLESLWAYVERGARLRDNAMTTPIFVTAGPGARTISLRDVDRESRSLFFHGDLRSRKVEEIRRDPNTIWVAWDAEVKQQFQFRGPTAIHIDDEVADRFWEEESPDELVFYFKESGPGTPVDRPTSGVDIDAMSEEEARSYFAVFRTEVEEILWHGLYPDQEIRARFRWDGEAFQGEWILP